MLSVKNARLKTNLENGNIPFSKLYDYCNKFDKSIKTADKIRINPIIILKIFNLLFEFKNFVKYNPKYPQKDNDK
jgi:hypothetical protein